VSQVSYAENFDSSDGGWTDPAFWFTRSTTGACSGSTMMSNLYSSHTSTSLISPVLGTSDGTTHTISFDYKAANWSANTVGTSNPWGSLQVQWSDTGGDPWTTIGTIDNSNHVVSASCTTKVYTFTPASGSQVYIRFLGSWTSGDFYLNLDNISVQGTPLTPPSCASDQNPTNLVTGLVRNPVLSWSAATGIPSSYDVYFGTSPTPSLVANTTNLTYTPVAPLLANTTYYWKIVPKNVNGDAIGCSVQSFTTGSSVSYCTPVTSSGCTDGDVIARVILNTLDNNSGTGCPSGLAGYSDYTANPLLTTTLQAGSSYSCTVYAGQYGEGYAAWIDYNDDGFFNNATERIGFSIGQVSGSGQVGVLGSSASFPIVLACNPAVGQHRLRVRAMYNTNGSDVTPCTNNSFGEVEDYMITITEAAACPQPTVLAAVNSTPSSINLTWNIGCAETAWQVAIQAPGAGIPAGSGVSVSSNNYDASALAAGSYEFYVRANCIGDGFSVWSGPFAFNVINCTTLVSPTDGQTNVDINAGAAQLTWSAVAGATSYDVYLGATSTTMNLLGNIAATTVGITGLLNSTTYFWKIVAKSGALGAASCPTWSFTTEGACSVATGLTSSAITTTTATVSWTAPAPAPGNGYLYEVRTSGAAGSGATGLVASGSTPAGDVSEDLTGLTIATTYQLYVRSVCDAITLSDWTGPYNFATTCGVASVPYTQDFEGAITPALPMCTSIQNVGTGNNWTTASPFTAGFNSKNLQYSWNGSNAANVWFYTQGIALSAGTSYRISYRYGNDFTFYTESLKVAYGTSASAAAMTNVLADYPALNDATAHTATMDITPAVTGVYYFGFNAYSIANQDRLFVDDISVTLTPVTISNFAPSTVCSAGGDSVTITGTTFTGATAVQFNGVNAASFTVNSDTSITAVTPAGVTGGYITVVTPTQSGSSTALVEVKANPIVAPIINGNATLCVAGTVDLDSASPAGSWGSSNALVATVDVDGIVTAVGGGSATISYSITDEGCTTTVTTSINVNNSINVSAAPGSQTVLTGTSASYTVAASGGIVSYQWQISTDDGNEDPYVNVVDDTTYSGSTTNTLLIASAPVSFDGNYYRVIITGMAPCANYTSVGAVLNVGNTGIIVHPSNVTLCSTGAGQAMFTVVASGDVDAYVWYEDRGLDFEPVVDGTFGGITYSGATTSQLTVSGLNLINSGWFYKVVVDGPLNDAPSNTASLTINEGVAISGNPTNQTVCSSGSSATFTVTTSGAVSAYQWKYSSDGISFANVVNGTPTGASYNTGTPGSLTVTTTAALPAGPHYYQVDVLASGPCSSVTSTNAQMLINTPVISAQPAAATVASGSSTSYTVATTSPSPSYVWQTSAAVGGPWTNVVNGTPTGITYTGASTATLNVVTSGAAVPGNARYYRAVVTSAGCLANSNAAQLTVVSYCATTYTSGAGSGDQITNVTLGTLNNASGASAAPYYTLYSGVTIPNIQQLTNASVSVSFGPDGNQYAGIWIDFNQNGVFESTEGVVSSATPGGNGTSVIVVPVPLSALLGNTRMRVRGGNDSALTTSQACGVSSSPWGEAEDYIVNVTAAPTCSGNPVAGTVTSNISNVCGSGAATLTATGYSSGAIGLSMQWYNTVSGAIASANGATYITPVLSSPSSYFLRVTCSNGGFTDSNTVTIGVSSPSVVSSTPNERCGVGSVALAATGSAGTTINWYASPTGGASLFTGTNFNTPSITSSTPFYAEANEGGTIATVGNVGPATGNNGTSTGSIGIVFNTTAPNVRINSVAIPFTGTGTFTIALKDATASTTFATVTTSSVTGNGLNTINVPLGITVANPGNYTLILNSISGSIGALGYKAGTFPSSALSGGINVTGGYWFGATTTNYYFFGLNVSNGCNSARTTVVATVNTAPTFTISSAANAICAGTPTAVPVTITSPLANYDTYVWSPATGVTGTAATGYTFNPSATTVYTLTASNATCAALATHTVTVNPLPGAVLFTQNSTQVCSNVAPLAITAYSGPTNNGGCLTAPNGQWPGATYTPATCNGATVNSIVTNAFAGEYSMVNLSANTKYVFTSSIAGDIVTVGNSAGTVILAAGPSPLTYTNITAQTVRFYTHNANCGSDSVSRTRSIVCGPIGSPVVWSPVTGLFTNAAGTTPYTGTAVSTVFAKPTNTTVYTATVTTGAGCTASNQVTITVNQAATYYADADADTFGNAAVSYFGCTPPAGYVTNNTDCNDANAAVHATFSFYVDADLDGYGVGSLVSVCAANATTAPAGYSLNNTDCNDAVAAINPGHVEVLYNGVDDNCDGQLDEGFQYTTTVNPSQCATTLSTINSFIVAVQKPNVTAYRFEVTGDVINPVTGLTETVVQTLIRTQNYFSPTMLGQYNYATTYSIRVEVQRNGIWLGYYGTPCLVSTPAVLAPGGAATVTPGQCGSVLPTISTLIATTSLPNVTGYKFRVTNVSDTSTPNQVQVIDRGTMNWFALTMLATYNYGTTYMVEIAIKSNGVYSNFGSPCAVTAPAVPMLANCGQSIATKGSLVSVPAKDRVTAYRFEITNFTTNLVTTLDRVQNWFTFNNIPNVTPGGSYGVRVAVMSSGVYSQFGEGCEITAPAGLRTMETSDDFKAVAYPNPFADNFNISVTTVSEENFTVKVYDMTGRLLETRNATLLDMQTLQVGDRYPSGVYNVILTQGENVATLRVIKR
jgi:hypothetical protein